MLGSAISALGAAMCSAHKSREERGVERSSLRPPRWSSHLRQAQLVPPSGLCPNCKEGGGRALGPGRLEIRMLAGSETEERSWDNWDKQLSVVSAASLSEGASFPRSGS